VHEGHRPGFGVGVGVTVGGGVGAAVGRGVVAGLGLGVDTLPPLLECAVGVVCLPGPWDGDGPVRPVDGARNGAISPGPGWWKPLGGVPPNPPTVSTVAVAALSAPLPAHEPRPPKFAQRRPMLGICPIQAPKPTVRQRRPIEMFRNARTIAGSSCVPATRVSS
jgi:hypothetical protein